MKTLYENAVVLTMDDSETCTDAFLVEDGRFVATGDAARAAAGEAASVDLEGRVVVPGLIDAHTHLESSAISTHAWLNVREMPLKDALARIAARVAEVPDGHWVIAQGTFGQEDERPTREVLDAISRTHPIIFRPTIHVQFANTLAMALAGLLESRTSPVGSFVERHDDGAPTGMVKESFHHFPIDLPAPPEFDQIMSREIRERFNRFGVTTIYEVPSTSAGVQSLQRLNRRGELTARISVQPTIKPGLQPLVNSISDWAGMGLMSGFGNDRMWLGAAKFFMDGAETESFDIERDREHPNNWGTSMRLHQELVNALIVGYENGIQFWIHAIGRDAQFQAIDAIDEAQRIVGGHRGLRTRIEHLGLYDDMPASILERMKRLNVIGVPTAAFMHTTPATGTFMFRTLMELGLCPPGNSDNAGSQPFATNPFFGLMKLATRVNKWGAPIKPDEKLSVYEGLQTYTTFAAWSGHKEGVLGVIAPGALADFAVLTADPREVDEEKLDRIESVLTVVGGDTVWEA